MSDVLISVAIIVVLSICGGFFAAAETSLVSLRESQLSRIGAERGRRGARLVKLAANPNRFLAAVQVGVTLAGFLSAGFGSARMVPDLAPMLEDLGVSATIAELVVFVVIEFVIVYIALVLGELAPKRIALQRPEATALALAGVVDWLARIAKPFIWLVSVSTNAVVRLLGMDPRAGRKGVSEEELRRMVAAHTDLSQAERTMIDDVFDAADRELVEVMVPRTEVQFLPASMPTAQAARKVIASPYSRYPVFDRDADDVIGFVHLRDILDPAVAGRSTRLGNLVREVARFPQSKRVLSALHTMRSHRQHLAIVVDEYGGTAGIVTLEDLVEELVGDITDEYDKPNAPTRHIAGMKDELAVDGLLNLDDFADATGIRLPEGPYETVAGFIMALLGAIPQVGDTVEVAGHRMRVVSLDGRRIAGVLVEPARQAGEKPTQPPTAPVSE